MASTSDPVTGAGVAIAVPVGMVLTCLVFRDLLSIAFFFVLIYGVVWLLWNGLKLADHLGWRHLERRTEQKTEKPAMVRVAGNRWDSWEPMTAPASGPWLTIVDDDGEDG